MPEQKELFSEHELYDACSRFKKCRKCNRRLHADHKERFETRVAGLCYACVRVFEKSSMWNIETFLNQDRVAMSEFMEAADSFDHLLGSSVPDKPFTRVVEYHFEVCGELIAITELGNDFVCVEESRKNGQEDTHMSGCLVLNETNTFAWTEGESMFVEYHSQKLADGIREHLNTYGLPTSENTNP